MFGRKGRKRDSEPLEEKSDEMLMLAFRQGDAAAFKVLLGRHQRPLFNFLLRNVRNRSLAEDLTQDVYMRVIKSAASYKQEAKFTTWLYTIARNLCIDQSRRAKHRKARSLDQPIGHDERSKTMQDTIADKGISVDRQVESQQLQGRIESAIAVLNDEQREVFLMRERLNLQFNEIAKIIGCSENTVKSRMRYALENLRKELADYRELAKTVNS